MPKKSYSAKQRKLAAVAPPRDKITAADLKKLRSKKKRKKKRNYLIRSMGMQSKQKTLMKIGKKHYIEFVISGQDLNLKQPTYLVFLASLRINIHLKIKIWVKPFKKFWIEHL